LNECSGVEVHTDIHLDLKLKKKIATTIRTMPLSSDAQVVETSNGLVATLRGVAGPHPGFRPGASNTTPCITRSAQLQYNAFPNKAYKQRMQKVVSLLEFSRLQ
jgi:hypothetical protein